MAHVERFEDLVVWQKARELSAHVYHDYRTLNDYGFRDQIQRATLSVMNNIAEGFDRKGNKEFAHFLFIAKGSCAEVRSMLYLAEDLKYSKVERIRALILMSEDLSRMLGGLIRSLARNS